MSVVSDLRPQWKSIGGRYLSGGTTYDIAKAIGVHSENIRQILIKLDIPRRSRNELDKQRANSILKILIAAFTLTRIKNTKLLDISFYYFYFRIR